MSGKKIPDLVEYWSEFRPSKRPYVHPSDCERLLDSRRQYVWQGNEDFEAFVHGERFGQFDSHKFHVSLLPVPYVGNLDKADIFILMANPGFGMSDYYGEYRRPELRKALLKNLDQDFGRSRFPFFYLDPEFCWSGGFAFWEGKLRQVLTKISVKRHAGRYYDALREMANRLAVIELVPYHSISRPGKTLTRDLTSAQAAGGFVRASLVPRACRLSISLVVARKVVEWEAHLQGDKFRKSVICYRSGHARGASLGTRSAGGRAILKRFGIRV